MYYMSNYNKMYEEHSGSDNNILMLLLIIYLILFKIGIFKPNKNKYIGEYKFTKICICCSGSRNTIRHLNKKISFFCVI